MSQKDLLCLQDRDALLFRLLLGSREWTARTAQELFGNMNLDDMGSDFLLYLGDFGKARQWEFFPSDVRARTEGLIRFYLFYNSSLFLPVSKVTRHLATAGIPFVITGDFAIRIHYLPQMTRIINCADILVHPQDYDRSLETIKAMYGDGIHDDDSGSTKYTLSSFGEKKLSCRLVKGTGGIWDRAIRTSWQCSHLRISCPEDLIILLLKRVFEKPQEDDLYRRIRWNHDAATLLPLCNTALLEELADEQNLSKELTALADAISGTPDLQ